METKQVTEVDKMKLKSNWINHTPNLANSVTIEDDQVCACGITERHRHCNCCGFLVSRGGGEVIGSYRFTKSGLKRIK